MIPVVSGQQNHGSVGEGGWKVEAGREVAGGEGFLLGTRLLGNSSGQSLNSADRCVLNLGGGVKCCLAGFSNFLF